ncbi:hypothetical protein B0H17DRAFT_1190695 [Mycena rosella]|uniref:Uncharacterized protein n=1 Tax=Mycena rosella TaxID=1033263 RepID=A0AAD7MBK7_MYCRO|nr:hypothetical protein B0H17DRAFT_1190695 [Mycena rosella]
MPSVAATRLTADFLQEQLEEQTGLTLEHLLKILRTHVGRALRPAPKTIAEVLGRFGTEEVHINWIYVQGQDEDKNNSRDHKVDDIVPSFVNQGFMKVPVYSPLSSAPGSPTGSPMIGVDLTEPVNAVNTDQASKGTIDQNTWFGTLHDYNKMQDRILWGMIAFDPETDIAPNKPKIILINYVLPEEPGNVDVTCFNKLDLLLLTKGPHKLSIDRLEIPSSAYTLNMFTHSAIIMMLRKNWPGCYDMATEFGPLATYHLRQQQLNVPLKLDWHVQKTHTLLAFGPPEAGRIVLIICEHEEEEDQDEDDKDSDDSMALDPPAYTPVPLVVAPMAPAAPAVPVIPAIPPPGLIGPVLPVAPAIPAAQVFSSSRPTPTVPAPHLKLKSPCNSTPTDSTPTPNAPQTRPKHASNSLQSFPCVQRIKHTRRPAMHRHFFDNVLATATHSSLHTPLLLSLHANTPLVAHGRASCEDARRSPSQIDRKSAPCTPPLPSTAGPLDVQYTRGNKFDDHQSRCATATPFTTCSRPTRPHPRTPPYVRSPFGGFSPSHPRPMTIAHAAPRRSVDSDGYQQANISPASYPPIPLSLHHVRLHTRPPTNNVAHTANIVCPREFQLDLGSSWLCPGRENHLVHLCPHFNVSPMPSSRRPMANRIALTLMMLDSRLADHQHCHGAAHRCRLLIHTRKHGPPRASWLASIPREAKSMDPQQRLLLHATALMLKDGEYIPHTTPTFNASPTAQHVAHAARATGSRLIRLRPWPPAPTMRPNGPRPSASIPGGLPLHTLHWHTLAPPPRTSASTTTPLLHPKNTMSSSVALPHGPDIMHVQNLQILHFCALKAHDAPP